VEWAGRKRRPALPVLSRVEGSEAEGSFLAEFTLSNAAGLLGMTNVKARAFLWMVYTEFQGVILRSGSDEGSAC
jgi:hypothetical protein